MTTKYECDRCGKYDTTKGEVTFIINDRQVCPFRRNGQEITHLCMNCINKIKHFIEKDDL